MSATHTLPLDHHHAPTSSATTNDVLDAEGGTRVEEADLADPLRAFVRAVCTHANVPATAETVAEALDSLRDRDGLRVRIDDTDHLASLLERMIELNARRP